MGFAGHALDGADRPSPRKLIGQVAPVSLADQHLLPVLPELRGLLPGGGLRRGTVVAVGGGPGSRSLTLALLAAASAAGSWAAAVGVDDLGVVAAAELGVALERFALVPQPGDVWPAVTAALLDALDLVVVRPAGRVRPPDARRLVARARERGGVLLPIGEWPEAVDVRLTLCGAAWDGLGSGHGHLRARRLDITTGGRGAASRERRVTVLLPAATPAPMSGGMP